jgi:hypothetical protein
MPGATPVVVPGNRPEGLVRDHGGNLGGVPWSTVEDIRVDVSRERRHHALRSIGLGFVAAVVLAGALGGLGVTSRLVSSRDGTLSLQVRHPQVARSGLAVPLEATISRPGGFAGEIEVSLTASYLDAFDVNSITPEPTAATASEDEVTWTFAALANEVLVVRFDVRVEPGVQWRRRGSMEVTEAGTVTRVGLDTWIAP